MPMPRKRPAPRGAAGRRDRAAAVADNSDDHSGRPIVTRADSTGSARGSSRREFRSNGGSNDVRARRVPGMNHDDLVDDVVGVAAHHVRARRSGVSPVGSELVPVHPEVGLGPQVGEMTTRIPRARRATPPSMLMNITSTVSDRPLPAICAREVVEHAARSSSVSSTALRHGRRELGRVRHRHPALRQRGDAATRVSCELPPIQIGTRVLHRGRDARSCRRAEKCRPS